MSNFYCSQKFWWLTVDPERKEVASCCSATSVKVDDKWLTSNPGQVFNLPIFQQDRKDMLAGKPVKSCEKSCWAPEQQGKVSRRLTLQSTTKTHTKIETTPEVINLILNIDCNMSCVYCCRQSSSSWIRDIANNGSYFENDPRFQLSNFDKLILQIGQKKLKETNSYQKFLNEVIAAKNVREVHITGGEPFLYNGLTDLLNKIDARVVISTGLGVNHNRFIKILEQIPSNVLFMISAENIGKLYEFTRYGNSYENFLKNLDALTKRFDYMFNCVISNLTIHGHQEFLQEFGSVNIMTSFCNDPDYLGVNVLDETSKQNVNRIMYNKADLEIKSSVNASYTQEQYHKFQTYVLEFARRRNLNFDIFPENFKEWILGDFK